MIRLKFIDAVLYQSIQITPGGQWSDYHQVPSETSLKEKQLSEKFRDYMIERGIKWSTTESIVLDMQLIAEQHFKQQGGLNSSGREG